MTTLRFVLALTPLFLASVSAADDHLVSASIAAERLQASQGARQDDLRAIDALLDSPQALRAAEALGQDPSGLRRGMQALSDAELHDLAARTRALEADPAAGLSGDVNQLLIIFLIVAIVILVIQAVD